MPLCEDTVPLVVSACFGKLGDTLPMWPPAHLTHLGPAAVAARRVETGLAPLGSPKARSAETSETSDVQGRLGSTPEFARTSPPGLDSGDAPARNGKSAQDEQQLRLGVLEDQQELLSKELFELRRRQDEVLETSSNSHIPCGDAAGLPNLFDLEARRKALGLEIQELRCQLRGGSPPEPRPAEVLPAGQEAREVHHQQQFAERLLRPVAATLEKLRSHFEEKQEVARQKAWQAASAGLMPGEVAATSPWNLGQASSSEFPSTSPGTTATYDGMSNCGLYSHGIAGHSTASPGSTPGSAAVHHQIGAADVCDVGEHDECSSTDEELDAQDLSGAELESRLAEVLAKLSEQLGVLEEITAMAADFDAAGVYPAD